MEVRLLAVFGAVFVANMVTAVPMGPFDPVPATECRSMMDLVLLVDSSDSILAHDYQIQRMAIKALIEKLHLGPRQSQVGIVVYSSNIGMAMNITYNRDELIKGATTMVHVQEGTRTDIGIAKVKTLFRDHGRKNVPWTCIVITDGLSKFPQKTAKEATEAKKMGINMFAVGISHFTKKEELDSIASDPKQVLMLKTFDQLQMSLSKLMKVVCPCPPLPKIPHGIFDDGPRSIGSVRTVVCAPDYQPVGNPAIECLKDSTWSPLDFACMACPDPPLMYGNGMVSKGLNTLNSVREYICVKGYSTPRPILSTCKAGPQGPTWTIPDTKCNGCPPLPTIPNGSINAPADAAVIGTTLSFTCNPRFIQSGPIKTTCVDKKGIPEWTAPQHTCIACGPPPPVPFADVDITGDTLINSVRVYTCRNGYHPSGPIEAICMGEKGVTYWQLTNHSCRACEQPPKLLHAKVQPDGGTLVGSKRIYICNKGYQETGPLQATCIANHGATFWDGPDNRCVPCRAPPIIPNAILDTTGDNLVGSIRTYKCMKDYIPNGPIEIGCVRGIAEPTWTAPEHQCITCPHPPDVPYATLDGKGNNYIGHKRLYHCIKGYVPSKPGPISIECIGEYIKNKGRAFWSHPSHECIACPVPPMMEFAEILPGKNTVGATRRYKCTKGFFATGPIKIKCLGTAEWSLPEHTCTACGPVPTVPNADVLPGPNTLGTKRTYVCHTGLVPDNPPTIKCLKNAKWSPVGFSCMGCKDPYKVKHAVLEPGTNAVQSVRRYTCLPGYYATGEITTTCAVPTKGKLPDWSTPVHYCKDCGDPIPVQNAIAKKGPRTIGSKQMYNCKKGFVESGPPVSHCMQNGEWSVPDFKCIIPAPPPQPKIIYVPVPVPMPVKKPKTPFPEYPIQKPKMPFPGYPKKPKVPFPGYPKKQKMPFPGYPKKPKMPFPGYPEKPKVPLIDWGKKIPHLPIQKPKYIKKLKPQQSLYGKMKPQNPLLMDTVLIRNPQQYGRDGGGFDIPNDHPVLGVDTPHSFDVFHNNYGDDEQSVSYLWPRFVHPKYHFLIW